MKRWSLIAGLLAGAALTGCAAMSGTPSASSPSPVIDRIVRRRQLRVGTSGPSRRSTPPPRTVPSSASTSISPRRSPTRWAWNLELVPMQFSELLPALQHGDVDMVLSGLTMTPERNLRVAFVGPYLVSGMSVLTKSNALRGCAGPRRSTRRT